MRAQTIANFSGVVALAFFLFSDPAQSFPRSASDAGSAQALPASALRASVDLVSARRWRGERRRRRRTSAENPARIDERGRHSRAHNGGVVGSASARD